MRLLDGKPWTHSTATKIGDTLRSHGFEGPEAKAAQAELEARHEGALRCMRVMQSQAKVTHINARRKC